ncbi:abl interactor 2 [Echinococcus multilocularis]|uniref:Abl interactor 2 n=1 Tax=Echinococcus multilocularis TaxID=6211 RepID=A0A068YIZ2_ECHMU|nr:abl interactor 2 [Echinococcus multilocularis]
MTVTESDLAESRNALIRTVREIQQAAKYCSGNYITAASNGQRRSIDETMNYATQSLGTMIHHINHLASAFLALLDERTEKMLEIEEKVAQLAMEVKIRREKVARKAIGSCTASKVPVKCTLTKVRQDPPMEYVRRPIDYSILDHIGHGTRSQEPVTSPYGAPVVHAQTLTRRGSTTAHQMGHHGNTINPKAMSIKVGGEYAATSVTASDYQSGTVGRTAGIYRTGVMGQYGNPYGGQQQVLLPMGRNHPSTTVGGGSGGYTSNSTGSLGGPSRRSSSSSGNQPRTTGGYAPAGMHMAQPQQQGVPLSTGYATKQQVFTDQGSPSHEQMVPPHQGMFARQHSEPGNVPASSVQHHLPAQYQQSPQAPLNRPTDVKNVRPNDLPPPPTEIPTSSRPQMSLQLDGSGCAKSRSQGHTQQQQQQYSQPSTGGGIGGVDLSRLQPGPMDQLRPRQHNDPPWAPHHYIQKVITVYEYTADKSDELTFGENELIYVIKKNDDGWWEGIMMNGRTGLFPGNYVEVIN